MGRIKCPVRLRPFSHLPGMLFAIPQVDYGVELFPTAAHLVPQDRWISLPVQGPVSEFTAMLDLERGGIKVFGKASSGHFCFWLGPDANQGLVITDQAPSHSLPEERLFLGVSKKPDWEFVQRRNLVAEVLPFWFFLGQMVPPVKMAKGDSLFNDLKQASIAKDILKVPYFLEAVLKTGFKGVLFPQAEDPSHLGYPKKPITAATAPQALLSSGYELIKTWLITAEEEICYLAPLITSLFTFGSAVGLAIPGAKVDLEWTKHKLRRVCIRSSLKKKYHLLFPKPLHQCRLTSNKKSVNLSLAQQAILDMEPDTEYFLDHFK